MKHVSYFLLVLISAAFLGSCSSSKYAGHIHHNNLGKDHSAVKEKSSSGKQVCISMEEPAAAPLIQTAITEDPLPEALLSVSTTSEPVVFHQSPIRIENIAVQKAKSLVKKAEQKQAKKQHTIGHRTYSAVPLIVEVLLAILLPPLAVYLHDGIGTSFWINLILTLLFIVPGIIHALLVVTDTI